MYYIAHLNIVRMLAPFDDPIMQRFVEQLDPVNGLADESEGFVWRLQTEEGFADAERSFGDPLLLVNMSVWKSIDHLRAFLFHPDHTQVMRERSRWFEPHEEPYLVLWWVRAGHIPSPDEAKEKLEFLAKHGPRAEAFTFSQPFPPPE